ncbi:MAG: putative transcriptional regulator [Bacteroidia bacterium]|jgi:predicted transcriptional regulator
MYIFVPQYHVMGLSKTDLFTEEQNALASMAKVLAHPARVAIIQYLIQAQACVNGDLVAELGLAQPTISQHLKELKNIGIIQGTIEGTSINYCINHDVWRKYETTFASFFRKFTNCCNPNCC